MSRLKFLIHFAVSHLFMLALPLINVGLAAVHMQLSAQADSADLVSTSITVGAGLAYSAWLQRRTATVANAAGVATGIAAATSTVPQTPAKPTA